MLTSSSSVPVPPAASRQSCSPRRDVRTTLVERSRFPREKVCGECVSSVGLDTLDRVGVRPAVLALGPTELSRSTLVGVDGSSHTFDLPRSMWGVRRSTMDVALLASAKDAGVNVEQPATVSRVEPTSAGVRVHLRDRVIDGDYAIVADGTSALLNGRPEPTGDFGLKAHFADVDAARDAIELVGLGGGAYAGLAPVDGGLFNAAWSVPGTTMRRYGGDLDRLFVDHIAASQRLRRTFARATRAGEWLACPLPRFAVRADWLGRVVPIGNAAAALEPVGGEGMGLAMRSAELAASAIADAIERGTAVDAAALRRAFCTLWSVRRVACRASAIALSGSHVASLTIDLARSIPSLARLGLRLVGKR